MDKYLEALKRAKQGLPIDKIFPELKESEDEKIRKEIKELVMQPTWKTEKEFNRRKELIAWLEKQGEQKPAEWSVFDAKKGDILSVDNCVLIVDSVSTFEGKPIIESWYCADSKKFYGKGTSMPDRWNIEGMKPASPIEKNYLFKMMKEAGYEWDADKKELKNIEQKPAEWSEEDEKKLSVIIDVLQANFKPTERFCGYEYTNAELVSWLNSLKPQNQWISVEDALPKENGWYLTLNINSKNPTLADTCQWNAKGKYWYTELCGDVFYHERTHWMEIPKLKGGEK